MAQTEKQQVEETERFRRAKARADLNARIAFGQQVPIAPEELAKEEERRFREAKGAADAQARQYILDKQKKRLKDRGNPPT